MLRELSAASLSERSDSAGELPGFTVAEAATESPVSLTLEVDRLGIEGRQRDVLGHHCLVGHTAGDLRVAQLDLRGDRVGEAVGHVETEGGLLVLGQALGGRIVPRRLNHLELLECEVLVGDHCETLGVDVHVDIFVLPAQVAAPRGVDCRGLGGPVGGQGQAATIDGPGALVDRRIERAPVVATDGRVGVPVVGPAQRHQPATAGRACVLAEAQATARAWGERVDPLLVLEVADRAEPGGTDVVLAAVGPRCEVGPRDGERVAGPRDVRYGLVVSLP